MLAASIDTGFGDEWVRVGGMKMVADGSISERTAWLSRPYVGRPSDFGIQVMTEQELYENGRKGTRSRLTDRRSCKRRPGDRLGVACVRALATRTIAA
jgi:predicted amidohydrolase YtcJ